MIRLDRPENWQEVPPFVIVRVLRRLRAGTLYGPQHFAPSLADLALSRHHTAEEITTAVEGLELAISIGDELSLDYCVYNDEQETIRSIERAAYERLRCRHQVA